MALINPLHALLAPCLFLLTLPLAIFAGLTTTIAFTVLVCRVVIVYLDIALSLLPKAPRPLRLGFRRSRAPLPSASRLVPRTSRASSFAGPLPTGAVASDFRGDIASRNASYNNVATSPVSTRRRRRRPSSVSVVSAISAGTVTPSGDTGLGLGLGLLPSIGLERDYEGIGGWRVGEESDNAAAPLADDAWTTINSRFELPDNGSSHRPRSRHHHHHGSASSSSNTNINSLSHSNSAVVGSTHGHGHGHFRSPSPGPTTPGEGGYLMMKGRNHSPESKPYSRATASPNSSRVRTPSRPCQAFSAAAATAKGGPADSYFPLTASPKTAKR